jgi:hypothetical protein
MASIEFTLNLNDPSLADFLADVEGTIRAFVQIAAQPGGFTETHRRKIDNETQTIDAPFLLRELYRLTLKTAPVGTLAVEVFLEQTLSFWVEYVLFLKDGLAPEKVERARRLVDEYDSRIAPELSTWIAEQIKDGWLKEDEMALLANIHIEKVDAPREVNVTQRDALFRLYGLKNPPIRTRIDVLPETNFPRWAAERNARLELIGTEAIRRNQPQVGREIAEMKVGNPPGSTAQAEVGKLLDDITRKILPVECHGDFRREELRLLSVFEWPEFKLEWRTITIKMRCVKIQVKVPWLRVRIAHLIVFIYYHVPKRYDEAIITIVKNCAIRSALAGAVIGVVVGNPAAAVAAFQSFFVDCLREDAFACVNPGLFLAKEVEPWQ